MLNAKQFIHLPMLKLGASTHRIHLCGILSNDSIVSSRQYEGFLGNLRMKSIVDIINERPPVGEKGRTINALYIRARFVYNTLHNFIASADPQITDEHVDNGSTSSTGESSSQLALTPLEKMVVSCVFLFLLILCFSCLVRIWQLMLDVYGLL